jgi:DNA-binding response OmpR family regulator
MARILVIEDDQSMNDILVATLTDDDHDVRSAFTGGDGVELCKIVPFDLVITDVRLPGMDGVEAISRIRTVQPGPKMIVITGYASADTPVRSIRLKVDDYLFKPFSLQYFLGSVNRVLDQDQKKNRKRDLVTRLFSALGRTGQKARDRKLEKLVEARQEAYRMLYVGVRSEYLNFKASRSVYSGLEGQEAAFRGLVNMEEPPEEAVQEMTTIFNNMLDRLAMPIPGETVPGQQSELTDEEFETLYNAMKSSGIGLDDLMHAPLLRKTPDERFETLPELLELKRQLWPSPV